jgi:thiol:disulfide interchange protein DsbG
MKLSATMLAAAMLLLLPPMAVGAPKAPATPPVLKSAQAAGLEITTSFKAVSGLDGWVVRGSDNQYSIVYTTSDGETLISGLLLNQAGENLTSKYSETYVPKPDYAKYWGLLGKSTWIATGAKQAKSVIYVFLDPSCTFCKLAWKSLQPYEAVGLQVRWVPVGILSADSAGMAAAIIDSRDPGKALDEHMGGYDPRTQKGGVKTVAVSSATNAKLQENQGIMKALGLSGTPATLYKNAKGEVMLAPGMSKLSELPRVTGLPAQPNDDPELARFR